MILYDILNIRNIRIFGIFGIFQYFEYSKYSNILNIPNIRIFKKNTVVSNISHVVSNFSDDVPTGEALSE